MNIKSLGNAPERRITQVRNDEASVTIGVGRPFCFNVDGTRNCQDVVLPGTAGAALATSLFAGIAAEDIEPGTFGAGIAGGFCQYALVTRQVRAATTDSFASAASIPAGAILQVDTAGNALSVSANSLAASGFFPAMVLAESMPSLASSASATSQTALRIETITKVWLRHL